MIELNINKHNEHCTGCGRRSSEIIEELEKLPFENKRRTWEGHTHMENTDYFYDCGETDYCAECGAVLDDEDFTRQYESRGEFWGVPCSECITTGYECSKCGNSETF